MIVIRITGKLRRSRMQITTVRDYVVLTASYNLSR
jgi:hypothetical protein